MSDCQELRDFLDRYGYGGKVFEKIIYLILRDKNISKLPSCGFTLLPNLEYLSLSNSQLTHLPEGGIGNLSNLTHLYLQNNQLTHLPEGVLGNLPNLTHLSLSDNQLTYLPECIGEYHALQCLYIDNNPLKYIPYSFKNLNVQMTFEEMEEKWIVKETVK